MSMDREAFLRSERGPSQYLETSADVFSTLDESMAGTFEGPVKPARPGSELVRNATAVDTIPHFIPRPTDFVGEARPLSNAAPIAIPPSTNTPIDNDELDKECPICFEDFQNAVTLPCQHKFCFLCIKGTAIHTKSCAMCRREIPESFFANSGAALGDMSCNKVVDKGAKWYYEGRNGWWQYDDRTCLELERHYQQHNENCETLIAGYIYHIDFTLMIQYKRDEPYKRRKVKRELGSTLQVKGVAGVPVGTQA